MCKKALKPFLSGTQASKNKKMHQHYQLTDQEFETQFESCTMNPQLFSHEAHLRLGYIHVKKYGVEKAAQNLCIQIKKFDSTFDEGTKFHVTVTVAAAKVMYHFMQRSESDNFADLVKEFPRLTKDFKQLVETHYGFDIFKDPKAKSEYIEPDLQAF